MSYEQEIVVGRLFGN